jgi:mannose-1-phosphate guanylyltransferase
MDSAHVNIIANKSHTKQIREQLGELPEANVIAEPLARNTAPAVGTMAVILQERDPDAIMLVLPADHFIAKGEDFMRLLKFAEEVIKDDSECILTLGIKPTYPETGYGYIEIGNEYKSSDDDEVFWVKSFKEKPDLETAESYVASWKFVWNSGMFVWKCSTILDLFAKHSPDIYKGLMEFKAALGTPQENEAFQKVYKELPSISVDYAIMEKAEKVLVMPADIGWSDIGSWAALHDLLSSETDGNVVIGKHVGVDTHNSLIHAGNKLIATVGIDNMIIVDSGDVLMICPKGRSQDVKKLLDKLDEMGCSEYL